jgi:hypothetical protein
MKKYEAALTQLQSQLNQFEREGWSTTASGNYAVRQAGVRVADLGADDKHHDGYLELATSSGKPAVKAYPLDGYGGLYLYATASQKSVATLTFVDQGGGLFLYDKQGDSAATLWVNDKDQGVLFLKGKAGMDLSETIASADGTIITPGTVVAISSDATGVTPTTKPYQSTVVGVVSGAGTLSPAIVLGGAESEPHAAQVAIAGQVYIRVCLEGGAIAPGDLLVPSSQRGVAMRASNKRRSYGAVVAKALERFGPVSVRGHKAEGLVRALVMTR